MFTRGEAEKRGYTFEQDGDQAHALIVYKDGAAVEKVGSDTPIFFALRLVAEREGVAFPVEVTPGVVERVSGEKYVEPPLPTPAPPRPLTADEALAEIAALSATATIKDVIAIAKRASR